MVLVVVEGLKRVLMVVSVVVGAQSLLSMLVVVLGVVGVLGLDEAGGVWARVVVDRRG